MEPIAADPPALPCSDSSPVADQLAWDGDRLAVLDETLRERLRRPALSPSTAKAMTGCPARWVADKTMPGEEDPFGAAELGTAAHSVLEDLFDTETVKPPDRTPEVAMGILLSHSRQAWPGKDARTYAKRGLWISEVHDAYRGIFDIEDPASVHVRAREMAFGHPDMPGPLGAPGIPQIEVAGVPFSGFIDRVDETADGVRVVDYKSNQRKPNLRFGDEHGDQIRLYMEAVGQLDGVTPAGGTLYYTRLGKSRDVPTGKAAVRKTLNAFKRSWDLLNDQVDRGAFTTEVSPLCGWCSLVNACPVAAAAGKVQRAEGLPAASDLGMQTLTPLSATQIAALTPAPKGGDSDASPVPEDDWSAHITPEGVPITPADTSLATHTKEPDMANQNEPLHEDKPYFELSHGTLNPNSYAAIAVSGIASWAYEEIHKAGLSPTRAMIDGLTLTLASIVTTAQRNLTRSVSFQDGANTRYRGALRSYVECHPIPFGGDEATWQKWTETAVRHITSIVNAGLRLHEAELPATAPYLALASLDGESVAETA